MGKRRQEEVEWEEEESGKEEVKEKK